jgi:hypothetical protein
VRFASGNRNKENEMQEIGKNQMAVLESMMDNPHKAWWPGCGWRWNTYSGTERILNSLVKRGMVEKKPWDHGHANLSGNWHHERWLLTEAGKQIVLQRSPAYRLKYGHTTPKEV